jgi:hypothetical protein
MTEIDNQYINEAINSLFHLVGIKDDISYDLIRRPFKKGKIKECIKVIAEYLGLPIEINLFYVLPHYNPNNTGNQSFATQQLVKTDARRRGIDGITAQVAIPSSLPLYGTSSFSNFPIDVKISENIKEYPDTFMAIMAHELSHVVLHSLRCNEGDNEIYTDITAMLLGFNEIMRSGRKTIKEYQEHSLFSTTTITETTTYGYLSDEQFGFAYNKIIRILKQQKKIRKKLIKKSDFLQKQIVIFGNDILKFKNYIEFLDKKRGQKINQKDAEKIILFHQPGYTEEVENFLKITKEKLKKQQSYYKSIKHYHQNWGDDLNKELATVDFDIKQKKKLFDEDLEVLKRNIGFLIKLKTNFKIFLK